jgi:hypothetical protein
MKLTAENRSTREKPVTLPLCPPQILHGLTRDRTRASAVPAPWHDLLLLLLPTPPPTPLPM